MSKCCRRGRLFGSLAAQRTWDGCATGLCQQSVPLICCICGWRAARGGVLAVTPAHTILERRRLSPTAALIHQLALTHPSGDTGRSML
jgi:hypothetical protein